MEKNSAASLLTSIDSLFTTQQERDLAAQPRVEEISLGLIDDFPDHPFKVRMDESMTEMADSVKQYGVLVPAIVRQKEDGRYEMVAGHRRKAACELAGKTKIPCVVQDLTLEEAVVVMVDSNLQREQILPSEKAFAYKMKLDAIRRQQGTRTDLTSVPLGQKLGKSSREMLAENSLDSNTQIQRYIRLTALQHTNSALHPPDSPGARNPGLGRQHSSERKRQAANCSSSCGGAFLLGAAGAAGTIRNHDYRGLHTVSCPGYENPEICRGGETQSGCDSLDFTGGKTQSERAVQDSQRAYQQVFCPGDARTKD